MTPLIKIISGSRLYGLDTPASDTDIMGVYIPESIERLGPFGSIDTQEDKAENSIMYELSHWIRLAAKGNPTVSQVMFAPLTSAIRSHPVWRKYLPSLKVTVLAQNGIRASFNGYMISQREKMMNHKQRPELVELYGYDTKFAMHLIRLGFQGVELLETGKLELPLPTDALMTCRMVRDGHYKLDKVLELTEWLQNQLLTVKSDLPETPDIGGLNQLARDMYFDMWGFD